MTSSVASGQRLAWGWVAGLRAGTTTPWREWRDEAERQGPYLPGAQQLELLRRLNVHQSKPSPELVERVLAASAPGRGQPDLELVGAAEVAEFGPRPVDPAHLPERELTRVATSLLAEDIVASGTPTKPIPPSWRWRRVPYRLTGDAWLADSWRDQLTSRGRPAGGKRPIIIVVGAPLDQLLIHAWTARAFDEGGLAWPDFINGVTAHRRLPPRADLTTYVRNWTDRVGTRPIHIALSAAEVQRLVGARRPLASPPVLAADAVELTRLVSAPLGVLVLPERRRQLLLDTWRPRLADAPGPPLGVPVEHADWLRHRAGRIRDRLINAGYAVHGSPDMLLPTTDTAGAPTDAGVLELAVRELLRSPQVERLEDR